MNRVKDLRIERGWTQGELARQLSTNQQTVSRYEAEDRGLAVETIKKLCEIFGVTSDYLIGRSDLPDPHLTGEESALIEKYRALSPAGQEFIRHSLALAALGHAGGSGAVSGLEVSDP